MTTPTATQATEWMRRLRSSVRCSIRLMPGSSARSVTALRALSIGSRSATLGGLAGCNFVRSYCGIEVVWDRIENRGESGVADGKTGRGWHEIEVAGGCNGQRLGRRFREQLLFVRVAFKVVFGDWGGNGVFGAVGDRWGGGSRRFHGSDFFSLLLLVGDAQLFFHLHAKLVGGAAELGHELAELAREFR